MTKKIERAIIFRAVNEAVKIYQYFGNRHEVAVKAAEIADRRHANISADTYREAVFIEALDKKEREGLII